jgi:hypothetical protein
MSLASTPHLGKGDVTDPRRQQVISEWFWIARYLGLSELKCEDQYALSACHVEEVR